MRVKAGRWMWWALLVIAAVMASTPPALAQGFYYKEIRKDERIYVFNIAEEADRFEKTGEMGRGLTRPGVGPNGETVVADSERALQLFFFKHNISEVVPEPPVPLQRVLWSDGKTRITHRLRLPRDFKSRAGPLHARDARRHHYASWHGRARRYKGFVPHPPCQIQAGGVVLDSTRSGSLASARRGSLPPHHAEAVL